MSQELEAKNRNLKGILIIVGIALIITFISAIGIRMKYTNNYYEQITYQEGGVDTSYIKTEEDGAIGITIMKDSAMYGVRLRPISKKEYKKNTK